MFVFLLGIQYRKQKQKEACPRNKSLPSCTHGLAMYDKGSIYFRILLKS